MSRSEIFIHYKETLRIHNFITKTNLEFPCTNYKIYEEYIIINNKTESIIIEIKNINKLNKELKINNKEEEIKYYNFKTNELQNIDITIKNEIINVFFHEVGRLLKVYEIKEKEIKEKIFEKVYLFKTSGNYFIINFQTHLIYRTFKEELIKTNEFEFYDIFENCFMYFKNKTIIKEKKKIINESILYVYEESILKKSFIFKNKFSWIKFNFLNNQTVFIIFESQNNSTSYYGIRTLYLYENEDIKIIDIPNPIHSINILNNKSYTIIYGDQPAKCIKLNLLNNNKELLPGNNRNYVFFNNIENLAIYAGINNLPGYF